MALVGLMLAACGVPPPPVPEPEPAEPPPPRLTGHVFEVRRERGIVFSRLEGRPALRLDLYVPECTEPHPFAVVVPGGGWRTGNRAQPDVRSVAIALAEEGVAAAAISHRPAPTAPFPAPFEDCRAAVRYLVDHADEHGLDPERFCTIGSSSGGHLAALVGVTDDATGATPKPRCVVALSAPLDFQRDDTEAASGIQIQLITELLGIEPGRAAELGPKRFLELLEDEARAASPLHWVDPADPPFLLVHGARDAIVPVGHSRRMHRALTAAGVPCTLLIEEDSGHVGYFLAVGPRKWHGEDAPRFWRETRRLLAARLLP